MNKELEWELVVDELENLVKYASKRVYQGASVVDKAISPEDLYQLGMIKLYKCWQKYKTKPLNEFKAIFKTSLFRSLPKELNKRVYIDLNEEISGEESYEENFIDNLILEDSIDKLKAMLSPISKAILLEIINPSPATLWVVWADEARKRHIKETQNSSTRLPRNKEVRLKHIREALSLSQKQLDNGVTEIREKAEVALVDAV